MSQRQGRLEAAWYNGAPWLWLLRPLELVFRLLSALRRALYRFGLLATYRADRPVVVVGNITVGGTGKTPIVIALVEALSRQGIRAGVVSRGYGAKENTFPYLLNEHSTAGQCGDEPLLVFRRTGAPCVVDPDRPSAVKALLDSFDVDLVISDDGLQHYALARDMEVAVVDAARKLGNGFCLPAGPLREPAARLQQVDQVLLRGSDDAASGVTYVPLEWVNVVTGARRDLAAFNSIAACAAVAGIGQPEQFLATLANIGVQCEHRVFADHHAYSAADFAPLAGRTILMTEKDAVKCRELAGPDAWFLRIKARLPEPFIASVAALIKTDSPKR